ncbi:16S rRNA (guanine(527)-N(7))-methyltransferase RsmG [Helicobacter jaachi]|uniref:Ribosomal RNA small subunit methyltransferase G n=1 Tax=Helicobacter jaachi TaxID=1677920 RepID=A0A4U8T7B7_9HELI|nr:16S rRNA (guanine(527)-N(7))-methyltransferase RsmG [Helicobacter jaachi]TLD95463.1 16S rRNA (guanine(527)-N(7))-methyltransferase RsmG [Helicobacter jaachi]
MIDLQTKLQQNKINLPSSCFEQFSIFAQELLRWTKIHNLTGASSIESVEENIFDSLYPLKFIDDFTSCMDIGSGGGFPAVPLAIAKKNAHFILIEPRAKRASFLHNIALELGLSNMEVLPVSIQNVPIADVNNIELITSRALMDAKELIALSRKFLTSDGYFLFYKGSNFRQEMPSMSVEECFVRENRIYYYKCGRDL